VPGADGGVEKPKIEPEFGVEDPSEVEKLNIMVAG
jgi:hypothetical protein